MTLEMIDREIGFAKTDRQTFRNGRANHERASQTRPARRGEGVDCAMSIFASRMARSSNRGACTR